MTASLFQPITLDGVTFPNRIAVAPMCQYSAEDGSTSDWHLYHWMNLAMSGAGMVTVEMTDVERRGRITHGCLGLYSDATRPPRAALWMRHDASPRRARNSARSLRMPAARPRTANPGRAAGHCSRTKTPGRPSRPRP